MVDQNRQIWYNTSMKVIKLDRRYNYFPKFKYAIAYSIRERDSAYRIQNGLIARYGHESDWQVVNDGYKSGPRSYRIWNDNWRWDFNKKRIYLVNEQDVTVALLLAQS